MTSTHTKTLGTQLDELQAICQTRGKKLTTPRREVLGILIGKQKCMKAYEILDHISSVLPNAKPVTVYRALDFLEKEGFIHRVDTMNGWTACSNAHNYHSSLLIVCTKCGQVSEIVANQISDLLRQLVHASSFVQSTAQTEVRAICKNCQAA